MAEKELCARCGKPMVLVKNTKYFWYSCTKECGWSLCPILLSKFSEISDGKPI